MRVARNLFPCAIKAQNIARSRGVDIEEYRKKFIEDEKMFGKAGGYRLTTPALWHLLIGSSTSEQKLGLHLPLTPPILLLADTQTESSNEGNEVSLEQVNDFCVKRQE